MKQAAKAVANAVFFLFALLPALLAGFGRFRPLFELFAQALANCPGVVGVYARRAYYVMTLRSCSTKCCIEFGTFFAHRAATVEDGVYIGAYCIIGRAHIGARTQIANSVHLLSGRHQHPRDAAGGLAGSEAGAFHEIRIGADCWIGSGAVVMADVGDGTTVGAGAVVTKDLPPRVVAAGVPARVIKPAGPAG